MSSLLLLDDDASVCRAFARLLGLRDVAVKWCTSPGEFRELASTGDHRGLLIDWNLRDREGTSVCEELRDDGDERPIGIMSAKVTPRHGMELALAAGADAYIDKTLDAEHFGDAVVALLANEAPRAPSGRKGPTRRSGSQLKALPRPAMAIEVRGDIVLVRDYRVELSTREREVQCLLERPGTIVSRETLARRVWGRASAPATTVVETTVCRLRVKLGSARSMVETVGDGYVIRRTTGRSRVNGL